MDNTRDYHIDDTRPSGTYHHKRHTATTVWLAAHVYAVLADLIVPASSVHSVDGYSHLLPLRASF